MKKFFVVTGFVLLSMVSFSQSVNEKLQKAIKVFENDPQLKAALSSLYVINAKTGAVVFDKNSRIGITPGSTQKIVTSTAAYELLGKEFRYKTEFGIAHNVTAENIYIKPSGDPTLGSFRWESTKEKNVLSRIVGAYKSGTYRYSDILIQNDGWNYETIPDGWVWQDIGNYFGAGADAFNWRENQFDLILKSGNDIGSEVEIIGTEPKLYLYTIFSLVTAGAKGSGDNSYIYFPINSNTGVIRGTIPVNENHFSVSGALPDAKRQFAQTVLDSLKILKKVVEPASLKLSTSIKDLEVVHTEVSPSLDSIIYWLNKKSINLYAEALVKTIGYQKAKMGSTEKGTELIKAFWKSKGVDPLELNILDGSGLSPSNRVTTHALVSILRYAKKQSWFPGFYNSLPEFNGIKMKSGTIKDVKGFAGYHTSKAGVEYIFSFIVNNYNGSTSTLVQKMYKVLDELK
jgi:D-alanyl-D-alanine carboxypeptidase/D-alanyl-D-alanine-endopeptidase (penicillin-binding protein 4)